MFAFAQNFSSHDKYINRLAELASAARNNGVLPGRSRRLSDLAPVDRIKNAEINSVENHQHQGFKVRRFLSGEVTGAFFTTGSRNKVIPPPPSGSLSTTDFTAPARIKIRRSVECSSTFLGKFCTLTFSPSMLKVWEKDEKDCVRHDFAKYKLVKFLDTCAQQQRRLGRKLNYLWVAELQENGNIHFHILWDKFVDIKYMSKIWAQGPNAVDIERMKSPLHASRYMRKYLVKDNSSEISGRRYTISSGLWDTMIPKEKVLITMSAKNLQEQSAARVALADVRNTLQQLTTEIESRGGRVLDFGFNIPMPRSSVEYLDRKTKERKKSKGVDPRLGRRLVARLTEDSKLWKEVVAPF